MNLKAILFPVFLCTTFFSFSQSNSPEGVVRSFFQAMYDADADAMGDMVIDNIQLNTTYFNTEGGNIHAGKWQDMIKAVKESNAGELNEEIANVRVSQQDALATVIMDYAFYHKGTFSHCGVNHFTLVQIGDQWKISSIIDTRRNKDCIIVDEKAAIDKVLSDWHDAAGRADSTAYFDAMTDNSVFVGTDRSEVWSKSAFLKFAAPYFAKGKAWKFKAESRNIYSDNYSSTAYFDEVLDTWMGYCRGSGIMVKVGDQWKIQHYVLSVTVPNDDIKEVIKIIDGK